MMFRALSCTALSLMSLTSFVAASSVLTTPTGAILHAKKSPFYPSDDEKKDDLLVKLFGGASASKAFFSDKFGSDILHVERDSVEFPSPVGSIDLAALFKSSEVTLRKWGSSDNVDKNEMTFEDFQQYIGTGKSPLTVCLFFL